MNSTTAVFQTLQDYAEMDAETWIVALRTLNTADGPIDQFKKSLLYIHKKLQPSESR